MHGSGQNGAEMTGVAKMRPEWAGQMNRMTGTEGTATPTPKRAGQGRMKMDMPQRKAMAAETLNTDREGGEAGARPKSGRSGRMAPERTTPDNDEDGDGQIAGRR